MQQFTYHKTGTALRSQMTMMLAAMMGDVVVIGVLGVVLPRPWNWIVLAAGALSLTWAVWMIRGPLRTCHGLDETRLMLRVGRFQLDVDRSAIHTAERASGLPRGISAPGRQYRPESDELFVLAERRGLVTLRLDRPLPAKTMRQGAFTFTRLTLSLDDPEAFIRALAGGADAAPAPATSAPATPAVPTTPPPHGASAPGAALRLTGLQKRYDGFTAVHGLDLAVAPGEILALLGSNGAGKSTTIRMIVGLLRPTAGKVEILGQDLWQGGPHVRRLIGYVPDVPILYESLTAREFLRLMAGLYDMPPAEGARRADELLAQMGMERWADQLIRRFSLGMKRKMAIAAALVHRPQVLLLDEVTNGLDPRAAREVKDFILAAAAGGAAVLLTTHLLDLAKELSDRIAVIHRGELRAVGTLTELQMLSARPGADLEELFLALTDDRPAQGVTA